MTVATMTAIDNPYWEAVRSNIGYERSIATVNSFRHEGHFHPEAWVRSQLNRFDYVRRYCWTIPDPDTLSFVARYSCGSIVDPMAGTGYWGWLLVQLGVDVVCYDKYALADTWNGYHLEAEPFMQVLSADAPDAVALHSDRALLLSWPPPGPVAAQTLDAYKGKRVIFMGEMNKGMSGDEDFYAQLQAGWKDVATRLPAQWVGLHDRVVVFDRKMGQRK